MSDFLPWTPGSHTFARWLIHVPGLRRESSYIYIYFFSFFAAPEHTGLLCIPGRDCAGGRARAIDSFRFNVYRTVLMTSDKRGSLLILRYTRYFLVEARSSLRETNKSTIRSVMVPQWMQIPMNLLVACPLP